MSDLLKTALILARRGDTDELVQLLESARRWRDTSADLTEEAIVEALGYQPARQGEDGGSGAVAHEISSRWEGLITATAKPFDVPFHHAYSVEALIVDADVGPSNSYAFDIEVDGTTVQTVSVTQAFEVFSVSAEIGKHEALVLRSGESTSADNLFGVTFSFLLTL